MFIKYISITTDDIEKALRFILEILSFTFHDTSSRSYNLIIIKTTMIKGYNHNVSFYVINYFL